MRRLALIAALLAGCAEQPMSPAVQAFYWNVRNVAIQRGFPARNADCVVMELRNTLTAADIERVQLPGGGSDPKVTAAVGYASSKCQ